MEKTLHTDIYIYIYKSRTVCTTKTFMSGGKTHRRVSDVNVMMEVVMNIRPASDDEAVNSLVEEKPGCSCQGPRRTLLFRVKTAQSNASLPIKTLK